VTNGTKPHIPKPSFNGLPYSSSSFIQTAGGGACGAVYLTPVMMLVPAPVSASGGTMLAKVGEILEIGIGSDV
jgi:hypothetical protein